MSGHEKIMAALPRVADSIEYTDLRKTITYRDLETMCCEAAVCGFRTVVVPSALVRRAAVCVGRGGPSVATVISYPFGSQSASVKAREAEAAVEDGARELDVVPHFGTILAERWDVVGHELAEIRRATGEITLKLVLEAGLLSSSRIREACSIAANQGFEYVVNTVGFRIVSTDPDAEGSASVGVLESLRGLVGDGLKLKAAGGVTTLQAVNELLDAGADRVAIPVRAGLLRAMEWMATEKEAGS